MVAAMKPSNRSEKPTAGILFALGYGLFDILWAAGIFTRLAGGRRLDPYSQLFHTFSELAGLMVVMNRIALVGGFVLVLGALLAHFRIRAGARIATVCAAVMCFLITAFTAASAVTAPQSPNGPAD